MKKAVIILTLFVGSFQLTIGQCTYRLKTIRFDDRTLIPFLLPPGSKIACEGFIFHKDRPTYSSTSRYQYHSLSITGISMTDYLVAYEAVKNGVFAIKKESLLGTAEESSVDNYFKYQVTRGNLYDLKVEVDMKALVNSARIRSLQLAEVYRNLVVDLYKTLDQLERDGLNVGWSPGITQNIVEKFFESFPIPQAAVLDKYLFTANEKYSYTLLDPKIWLEIDHVERVPTTSDPKFWQFSLMGTTILKYYRNNKGNLVQSPAIAWQGLNKHENYVDHSNPQTVLLAASSDIQLSSSVNTVVYLGVFSNSFKPNNSVSPYAIDYVDKFAEQNSLLLFHNRFDKDFFNSVFANKPLEDKDVTPAVYGLRNLITPVIQITINHASINIPLGASLGILQQQGRIPELRKIVIKRPFKGHLKRIPRPSSDLIFLPGDELKY